MKFKNFRRFLLPLLTLLLLLAALPAAAEENSRWTASTSEDEDGNTIVDLKEVRFVLPKDWVKKVQLDITPSTERANVYHIASREKWTEELGTESGGFLFGIVFTEDPVEETDDVQLIGQVKDGYYYLYFPTDDDQAYTKDEETAAEYADLWADIDWIKEHCEFTGEEKEDEYIIPNSSDAYLTEEDLEGMNANKVQMAINEIYARHHRKFDTESIQEYFDEQSWYSGTIDPDDFTEEYKAEVMNDYEKANIDLMYDYMNRIS